MTTNFIETRPLKPLFFAYLYPALIGMILMSVNILVDGIFVSQGIGPTALAGINIAVPIFSILLSISLWIGVGGATLYSIALGRGNVTKAQRIFSLSFLMMFVIVSIIIVASLWKMEFISYLFGADAQTYPYVKDYLYIVLVFGMIYTIENLLSIFIRNDGNPKLAMAGLIVTSIVNIILNYLFIFVWSYGVAGVALATVISTVIGTLVLCMHFIDKQNQLKFVWFCWNRRDAWKIMNIGLPSFIVEGSLAMMVVLYNVTFLYYFGTIGVTAFAMVNYLHVVLLMVFLGVGMGMQPLVSYHYGARLMNRVKGLLKISLQTGAVIGIGISLLAMVFPSPILSVFGSESVEGSELAINGFKYFAIGYIFLGINMVLAEFFQAIEKVRLATIIILLRSMILFIPLLLLLPKILGAYAIWWVFPITEGVTTILIGVYFALKRKRSGQILLKQVAENSFVEEQMNI